MRLHEVKPTKSFLYESMLHKNELSSLTYDQRMVMEQVEETLLPYINQYKSILLTEAPISSAQIGDVFQQAADLHKSTPAGKGILQKSAKAIGQSLPVKVVRQANAAIDDLGKKIQDTEPVQNFDAAVSRQIQEIKAKLEASPAGAEIVKAVQKYAAFGKENPGKQAIILSVVILAASFAAGPLGGALAGFIMRAGNDLIAGKKASSAVGGAAKAAAIGALVGFGARWLGDAVIGNIEMAGIEDIEAMSDAFDQAAVDQAMAGVTDEFGAIVGELDGAMTITQQGSINAFYYDYDIIMTPDVYDQFKAAQEAVTAAGDTFSPEWYTEVAKFHDMMAGFQADPDQSLLRAALEAVKEAQKAGMSYADAEVLIGEYTTLEELVANLEAGAPAVAAAAQTAAQTAGQFKDAMHKAGKPEEPEKPVPTEMIPTTESIDEDAELYELAFPNLKKMAGTAARGLGKAVTDIGTVQPKQLMKAWKKAGSPEDTDSIRNILVSMGMSPDVIDTSFSNAGVEAPPALDAPADADADADAETPTDTEEPADAEAPAATTGSIPADISMRDLAQMLVDAGLVNMTRDADTVAYTKSGQPYGNKGVIGGVANQELAKLIAHVEHGTENKMRVDEMCGVCGDEMEAPKTNYNLSVTKDEGSTHKTMTVTSDQPDELIRVLQLSGMDTGHSEPDGDEIAGVDMDHDEPMDQHSQMKGLIAKIANPHNGDEEHSHGDMTHSHPGGDKDHEHDDEAHEEAAEVEQDIRSKPSTFSVRDLVPGQVKKQPRQRKVAAKHGDNPYKDAGQLEEKYIRAYSEFKEG